MVMMWYDTSMVVCYLRKQPSVDINQIRYLNLLIPLKKTRPMLELVWSCLASPLLFLPNQDFDLTRLAIDINQICYLYLLIPLTKKGKVHGRCLNYFGRA